MGTKRPSCTLFDTLSNINMSDRKLQPGGKISRDPSPRPAMTAQSERDRDGRREDDRRRETDMEKIRDKPRYKDTEPRYNEIVPASRIREGEREWRERDRRQEDDRGRNSRPLSNVEKDMEQASEREMKKGDTFPRTRKKSAERGIKMSSMAEADEDGRQRDRPRQIETDDKERVKTWQAERYRSGERDVIRARAKEEQKRSGGRPVEDEKARHRERYREFDTGFRDRGRDVGDTWDRREGDAARMRQKPRPNMGERGTKRSSPRRRDREVYSNRKEREQGQRTGGRRDTRSEGDSDERELRRERMRDRERDELMHQHSRSEGDSAGKRVRDRDENRQGYREEDRQRYRDRERDVDRERERDVDRSRRRGVEKDKDRYREADRRAAREGERWKESGRDLKDDRVWSKDRREEVTYREYEQRRDRERKDRELEPRWDDTTGRSSRSQNKTAPTASPRSKSSGEWSSDMDSETRYKRGKDSYEERESGRESERDADERRDAERADDKSRERLERDGGEMGSVPEQRRMWLEPQRGKNSEEEFVARERHTRRKEKRREEDRSVVSQAEWGGEVQQVKEEPSETNLDQSHAGRDEYRRDMEQETEGVSVDEEAAQVWRESDKGGKEYMSDSSGGTDRSWRRDAEGANTTDNTEESDGEEESRRDYLSHSKNGEGRKSGWKQERDSMLSGEDGFVTLSSGGDEEDEREADEDEEFEDCQEFWEGEVECGRSSPAGFKGYDGDKEREGEWTMGKEEAVDQEEEWREKQPKYVFCVIGQTLPRSNPGDKSPPRVDEMQGVERGNPNIEKCHPDSDDVTQQPQNYQHATPSSKAEYPCISTQEDKSEYDMPSDEQVAIGNRTEVVMRYMSSSEHQDTEAGEGRRSKEEENPYDEIGQIKRDSQTERLLVEWREKNKELVDRGREDLSSVPYGLNFEQIQPILDELNTGAMSPEEVEAIRIRLSGAWSMSEEPKRHSQAPHLKWAKNVVREILGQSEEKTVDEPSSEEQGAQTVKQRETAIKDDKQQGELSQRTGEFPVVEMPTIEVLSEAEEGELFEMVGLRGMRQSHADMHADQYTAMHDNTPTHTHKDTLLDTDGKEDLTMDKETDPSGHPQLEKADVVVKMTQGGGDEVVLSETEVEKSRQREVEMFLSVSNTLYKPNSCPILNYECGSDLLAPSTEGESQEEGDRTGESEEEREGGEDEERATAVEVGKARVGEGTEVDSSGGEVVVDKQTGGTLTSTCSFRDLGPKARSRRRGIRKTTQRRKSELVEVEEEEGVGVGRDRRTRIFSATDDEDDRSKSWGEVDLRNVLETLTRRKRNSRFFNAAQLYQQYSEAAQNIEILRQARSDVPSVSESTCRSPAPSPPPARRPLPPLPPVPHPHSLSHTGSITSVKSLPLPEPRKSDGRPSSPRLSLSLTQSATLWQELPGVRNSRELEELTGDQRRLQEVRFEVVTSEASYCRSLDIVVDQFVKSKQLGVLLTTQDRNWLFSRLADVRAISHSFLSKLEERMEEDLMHFTVCDIIARHYQRFKMVYVPYLTNQSYQDATYQRLMNENQAFKRIVEKIERSPVCQRLPLRSFLVLPFQRITRLKLLVQNIVKRTTPGTAEATQAIKALKLLEKLIQESNDSISQMKSIESLVSLSAKVDFECRTLPLISQSRRLVREGLVTELIDFSLKDTERNIYLHLFNDYLLLSLQKEGGRFTVIDHSPVSDLRAENCRVKLHSLQKNLFRLHMSHKSLLLRTDTQSDKLRWISALSRPHPEIDFSAAQDFPQMQCIRAFVGQQPDELSLEKADIILVHQQSSDHWVEGTRLSDRHHGWVPQSHLENISNSRVRQRNLSDALKLTNATAAV